MHSGAESALTHPTLRSSRDLVGNHGVSVRERVSHHVEVCDLEECVHGSRLIPMPGCPGADGAETLQHLGIRTEEEPGSLLPRPIGQVVGPGLELIPDLSMLNICCATLAAINQSQNAGQKSKP